jgi:hypothetical protein
LDNASILILKFTKVQTVNGKPCAVFDTLLESTMTQGTTMKMQMQGKLMLEIETCRAASIELAGPVKLAEAHGPADGQFTINTQGSMKMALRAGYTQVR